MIDCIREIFERRQPMKVVVSGKGAIIPNPEYVETDLDRMKWQEHIRKAKESVK